MRLLAESCQVQRISYKTTLQVPWSKKKENSVNDSLYKKETHHHVGTIQQTYVTQIHIKGYDFHRSVINSPSIASHLKSFSRVSGEVLKNK